MKPSQTNVTEEKRTHAHTSVDAQNQCIFFSSLFQFALSQLSFDGCRPPELFYIVEIKFEQFSGVLFFHESLCHLILGKATLTELSLSL